MAMKWHPTFRPWLSDTPEETRYVGLVLNGSLENKVVTREREPFFVMVREAERHYSTSPRFISLIPGVDRDELFRRPEIESYVYERRWRSGEQIGVWRLSDSSSSLLPEALPEDNPGNECSVRDVEMEDRDRWFTLRKEGEQWIVEVNDYYVQRGRVGGKAADDERWVQENLRANPSGSVMRVSSDGTEWAEFDVRDPALVRYTEADDSEPLLGSHNLDVAMSASWAMNMNITLDDEQRRVLNELVNGQFRPASSFVSPDSMSMTFDLERTDICWKNVTGVECGEPADPESDNGLCSTHLEEIRSKVKMK